MSCQLLKRESLFKTESTDCSAIQNWVIVLHRLCSYSFQNSFMRNKHYLFPTWHVISLQVWAKNGSRVAGWCMVIKSDERELVICMNGRWKNLHGSPIEIAVEFKVKLCMLFHTWHRKYTEIGSSLGTWFGENCSCPRLASRNKFHQTLYRSPRLQWRPRDMG